MRSQGGLPCINKRQVACNLEGCSGLYIRGGKMTWEKRFAERVVGAKPERTGAALPKLRVVCVLSWSQRFGGSVTKGSL